MRPWTAGDFTVRIDRAEPLARSVEALSQPLSGSAITLDGIIWQAEERQGLVPFGTRLRDLLLERFTTRPIRDLTVRFQADSCPDPGDDPDRLADHCYKSIYGALAEPGSAASRPGAAVSLDQLIARIERFIPWSGSTLFFGHEPLDARYAPLLREYWLTWLYIRKQLERSNGARRGLRLILAVPLRVAPGEEVDVGTVMTKAEGGSTTGLGLFGSVSDTDLAAHMRDFGRLYNVRDDQAERVAAAIYGRTAGVFEATRIELKTRARLI